MFTISFNPNTDGDTEADVIRALVGLTVKVNYTRHGSPYRHEITGVVSTHEEDDTLVLDIDAPAKRLLIGHDLLTNIEIL